MYVSSAAAKISSRLSRDCQFLVSSLFCVAGGNPWDVKKKKAKKKKAIKVDEAEEGDILENGDVRTKGAPLIPCHYPG